MAANAPTVGSLFSGIGGFELGFEWAGFRCQWQVENDPFCQRVLAHHWPGVPRHGDIRTVRGVDLAPVDWIVGGFPCQNLSIAGRREGLHGPQSGLHVEFLRLIAECRPSGVVIENSGAAWKRWVPGLRRALWGLGYASLPLHVRASDFGAWHRRHRVYLIAHVDEDAVRLESWRRQCWPFRAGASLFADAVATRWDETARVADGSSISWRNAAPTDAPETRSADREGRGADAGIVGQRPVAADPDAEGQLRPSWPDADEWRRTGDGAGWPIEPDVVRGLYEFPGRVDGREQTVAPITEARYRAEGKWYSERVGALGNAVLPCITYWIARSIREITS